MTALWRKAVSDLRHERIRTILVILAIALGMAGFTTVMASYSILTRELDHGYLATNPASVTLRTDRIDDGLVKAVLANPEVSDAEPRRGVSGRVKVGPAEWRNLVMYVVKDYGNIRVSRLQRERGAWPPAAGEMLIERDAMQVARAQLGETVIVKTAAGREARLRVSGIVHDVGQAQARMENIVYGYIITDTLPRLGEEPYLDQLNILVARDRFNQAHVRDVATQVQAAIEGSGHPVRRTDIPPPGKHPHSDLMGTLLLSMSSFGLFVLLLSGILVLNLLMAMMASQVRQIGVMKAMGGTRSQVSRIYFSQALLLGIGAMVVGVPLGLIGSRFLCGYLAVFLNFDIASWAVPAWVFALVGAVGCAVPLVAAAWPVLKGSGVSVREALADFGISQTSFGEGPFERQVAKIGGRSRPLLLALRNCLRRRVRLALTLTTMVTAGIFFMTALNVRASLVNTLDALFHTRKSDLTVVLGTMYPAETVARAVAKTAGIVHWEGWISTEGRVPAGNAHTPESARPHSGGSAELHGGGPSARGDRFTVIAVPKDTELLSFDLQQGRALVPGDTDSMVVNTALARKLPNLKLGETTELQIGPAVLRWKIVGIAREAFSPPVAYIPRHFFDQMHPGSTNSVRLVLARTDDASMNAVKASLDQNFEQEQVRAVATVSRAESRYGFDQHMLMIYVFLLIMSGIISIVGTLGLATSMSLNVLERRREMGVLRTIGATPGAIGLIVVGEAIVVGILSWLVASLLAWPVGRLIGNAVVRMLFRDGLNFYFSPAGPAVWLVISIVFAAAASLVPAWHASRVTIREAVAYE